MSNFAADIARFATKVGISLDAAHSKICLDLFRSLVMKSPVDTGRFRGNWQIGVGAVNLDMSSEVDKAGGRVLANGTMTLLSVKAGGIIYLTNSLPYAIRLEYGSSQQAPQGMVRITMVEHRSNLTSILAGLN
jgi:hypothetical protein